MIYDHTKFHTSIVRDALLISIKSRAVCVCEVEV